MPLSFSLRLAGCSLMSLLAVSAAVGREYSPRVVSPHNADAYSLKTFAQYPRWRDLKGNARAWEMFRYLADSRTGLYPLQPVAEGNDVLPEYRLVRDPVKLINVYGYGFCGILGPTMAGICEETGTGPARTLILPGWNHVVAETFYDGKWHYLDLDVRAAFRRPDGSLASMADAQRDASLWQGPQGPLFFPLDRLEEVRKVYAKTPVRPYYNYHFSGHTMDYVLRQGETFTRWWKPQGGRWHHAGHSHDEPFFRKLFEGPPRGPRCRHAGWTVHTHGNGRFVYQPDLTGRSSDFADGVYDADNVQPAAGGLTLRKPGQGHAVFEVRSPYIIVPLIAKLDTRADDREASVVQLDNTGEASLAISLDNGMTWKDLERPARAGAWSGDHAPARGDHAPARAATWDLTRHASGTYGYLLKITLRGEPGTAIVRSLKVTTWVQLAPASLPSLRQGKNRLAYRTGDHYGLGTRVMEIRTNGSDRADFLKYLSEPPADFDPARKSARAKGPFVVKLQAPPHTRIAWFSAGANFNTHQQKAAEMTRNSIAFAVDQPKEFRLIYEAKVPPDQDHWHYNADREIKLDTPAKTAYLRYVGDPGVNNLRIYAHCLDERPLLRSSVVIKHTWSENGTLKSKSVTLDGPGAYEIETLAEPRDESLEMAVRSSNAPRD